VAKQHAKKMTKWANKTRTQGRQSKQKQAHKVSMRGKQNDKHATKASNK
jgi:hypothetical protein